MISFERTDKWMENQIQLKQNGCTEVLATEVSLWWKHRVWAGVDPFETERPDTCNGAVDQCTELMKHEQNVFTASL